MLSDTFMPRRITRNCNERNAAPNTEALNPCFWEFSYGIAKFEYEGIGILAAPFVIDLAACRA
jgi:hypothetical protein